MCLPSREGADESARAERPGGWSATRPLLVVTLMLLAVSVAGVPSRPVFGAEKHAEGAAAEVATAQMPGVVDRYAADRESLEQVYRVPTSTARLDRMQRFYEDQLRALQAMPFDGMGAEDRIDYLLLRNKVTAELHQLSIERRQLAEEMPLLPFANTLEDLLDAQRKMQRPDAERAAAALNEVTKQIAEARRRFAPEGAAHGEAAAEAAASPATEKAAQAAAPTAGGGHVNPVVANRAVTTLNRLLDRMNFWFKENNGYDPAFTWWVDEPWKTTQKALTEYRDFLKEKLVGIKADDKTTIIGDPVGRQALDHQLQDDLIPYTPEELVAIAETEYDWCMREMLKASHEMGYGDDWHAAVEKVKTMHVPPGEQPELIRKLVVEGSDFVKKNDLVTVPPLADETWRMIMMTPERQLVNPFFTGGDEISVSYPTDTMTYAQREMSMRGNNIPFARATAFHEMIPGHFLQFYMGARYRPYRQAFETPFWVEGNALWWEMLFWDKGFDRTPEERVGALVWRMHRSARVIFTMNFHLGRWTPQQCVQFLIDAVGFEPDNATAEVRRSFDGSVGPLYQCAYLMGALQFRALHKELVDSGKMTNRAFHDAILHENMMPVELLRADLEHLPVTRDYTTQWRFYGEHPTHAEMVGPAR